MKKIKNRKIKIDYKHLAIGLLMTIEERWEWLKRTQALAYKLGVRRLPQRLQDKISFEIAARRGKLKSAF